MAPVSRAPGRRPHHPRHGNPPGSPQQAGDTGDVSGWHNAPDGNTDSPSPRRNPQTGAGLRARPAAGAGLTPQEENYLNFSGETQGNPRVHCPVTPTHDPKGTRRLPSACRRLPAAPHLLPWPGSSSSFGKRSSRGSLEESLSLSSCETNRNNLSVTSTTGPVLDAFDVNFILILRKDGL